MRLLYWFVRDSRPTGERPFIPVPEAVAIEHCDPGIRYFGQYLISDFEISADIRADLPVSASCSSGPLPGVIERAMRQAVS